MKKTPSDFCEELSHNFRTTAIFTTGPVYWPTFTPTGGSVKS
jgi:hypothetical protein